MALTPEDGTGLSTADSYISQADATTYFAGRITATTWTDLSSDAKDAALRYAADWLSARYTWIGERLTTTQALAWPRTVDYDLEGRDISTQPPTALKRAQCEAALAHVTSPLNSPRNRGGAIKAASLGSGAVSVTYADGAPGGRTFDHIDDLVAPLTISGPGNVRAVLG